MYRNCNSVQLINTGKGKRFCTVWCYRNVLLFNVFISIYRSNYWTGYFLKWGYFFHTLVAFLKTSNTDIEACPVVQSLCPVPLTKLSWGYVLILVLFPFKLLLCYLSTWILPYIITSLFSSWLILIFLVSWCLNCVAFDFCLNHFSGLLALAMVWLLFDLFFCLVFPILKNLHRW